MSKLEMTWEEAAMAWIKAVACFLRGRTDEKRDNVNHISRSGDRNFNLMPQTNFNQMWHCLWPISWPSFYKNFKILKGSLFKTAVSKLNVTV
jgi:hypothetical protein